MKELGKIKERYEFSFDARQLGLFLFAAALIAALAFVLGMSVGIQWERKKNKEAVKPVAGGRAVSAPVVKKEVPVVPAAPPVAPPVMPPAAQQAAQPEPQPPAPTVKKSKKSKADTEVKAERLTFPKVLTSNTKKTAPMTPVKKTSKTASTYTVQAGAYNEKGAAQEFADKLRKKGYDARVDTVGGRKGAYVYKVRVGSYDTRDEAKAAARKLEGSERLVPYVTREK